MDKNRALTIKAFGGFSITDGEDELRGFDRARVQELLVYLLLKRGQAIARSEIASLFWPESSQKQAFSNLRNLFYYLRQNIPNQKNFLTSDSQTITCLHEPFVFFDVAEFKADLSKAENAKPWLEKVNHLENAANLYQGELLPGNYSNWLLFERKQQAQGFISALSKLVSLYETRRQYQKAIVHAQTLIQHDPLHEPAYIQLMRLHALDENRAAALNTYHSCVNYLRREIGIKPSQKLQNLYEQIINQKNIKKSNKLSEVSMPLVGRDKSWKQLQQSWKNSTNQPKLVLIRGESGIGKTRLAEAFGDWFTHQGGRVLNARCYTTETSLAYAPIITWLRSSSLSHLDSSQLTQLYRFLPEIGNKYPDLAKPQPITDNWQRICLYEALEFALFAGQKSLMLIIDDLQWCDPETLDWLSFLLSASHIGCDQTQLLILAGLQSDNHHKKTIVTDWETTLKLKNQVIVLDLDRLNQSDTFTLANNIADHSLDPKLKSTLYKITEGHPFIITELISAAMPLPKNFKEQRTVLSSIIPNKVRHVLEARINQLSTLAREVAEQASVIGRSFTYPVLSQLTHLNEQELVKSLDECWQRQVIREQEQDTYDFSHNKLHQVIYEGISLTRRRWLHRQVAKILESLYAEDLGPVAGTIADHYEKAGFIEQAISYYDLASQKCTQIYSYDEATTALEKVISLVEKRPEKDRCLNAALHERIGDIHVKMAKYDAAFQAYQSSSTQMPTTDIFSQARVAQKIGNVLKNNQSKYQLVADQYQHAADILNQPSLDRDETWWEAWCELQLEQMDFQYCYQKPDVLRNHIENVRSDIETFGTQIQKPALNKNLMFYSILKNRYISTTDAVIFAQNALEALPETTGPDLMGPYRFALGFSQLWHGEYDDAIANLKKASILSEKCSDILGQARCLAYLVLAYRLTDQQSEVEKSTQACLSIAERTKMCSFIGVSQAGKAWLILRRADHKTPYSTSFSDTKSLAQQAMTAWQECVTPFPFQWQSLWLLMYIAMLRSQFVDAVYYARQLCNPMQQALDPDIEDKLTKALTAWKHGSREITREMLTRALISARKENFL